MKKIILLLLFFMPYFLSAQKIQNVKTDETADLKEKVESYCAVVMQPVRGKMAFYVGVDELGAWQFLDENNNPINFETIVAVLNYMKKNGWEYIDNIGGTNGAAPQYFFRKAD